MNNGRNPKKSLKARRRIALAGMLLIALGVLLVLLALGLRACTSIEQEAYIAQYLAEESEAPEAAYMPALPTETSLPDTDLILAGTQEEPNGQPSAQQSGQAKKIELLGILEIPKLKLRVAIGEGVDKSTLRYTVGHFRETAPPGAAGNCCIIGHRSYITGKFFNRLNELAPGDDINVRRNGKTYTFSVTDSQVVDPSDVSVLSPTLLPQLTLITCTPIRVATHRLVVRAALKQ